MKSLPGLKVLFLVVLTCLTAQGNVLYASNNCQEKTKTLHHDVKVNNLSVVTGQVKVYRTEENLTIGEANPVTIENEGKMTLVAGKTILLLPGTKISSGGFLYASIEPGVKDGHHSKKVTKLVTIEEKEIIEEQASLAKAVNLFKPFPNRKKGLLHAGDPANGNIIATTTQMFGVTAEQQWKFAVDNRDKLQIIHKHIITDYNPASVVSPDRAEFRMVLRL